MAVIRQYLLLLKLGLSTLPQRRATALTVLIATACVVGVLLSMLSATAGVVDAFRTATDPHIAVVLPNKDLFDSSSDLPRDVIGTILNAPGFSHGPDGRVLGDAELLFFTPPAHRIASGGALRIRGMGARGAAIRPGFRITSGRMFQSGRQELIVGAGSQRAFGLNIGDKVRLREGSWPIVGVFAADGVNTNELIGDVDTLAAMMHRSGYGSVQARLETPAKLSEFRQWLVTNPALAVTAETQQSYFDRIVAGQSEYFTAMGVPDGRNPGGRRAVRPREHLLRRRRRAGPGSGDSARDRLWRFAGRGILGIRSAAAVAARRAARNRRCVAAIRRPRIHDGPEHLPAAHRAAPRCHWHRLGTGDWRWPGVCCRPSAPPACRSARRCARPSTAANFRPCVVGYA